MWLPPKVDYQKEILTAKERFIENSHEIKDEEENEFSLDDYFNQANEERSSNNPPAYRM